MGLNGAAAGRHRSSAGSPGRAEMDPKRPIIRLGVDIPATTLDTPSVAAPWPGHGGMTMRGIKRWLRRTQRRAPRWLALCLACVVPGACAQPATIGDDDYRQQRARMVERQLAARDIHDPRVLAAMRKVPRHRFVAAAQAGNAYDDRPLSIGHGQTISQPYIVALMTQLADPQPGDRVLEIGTGSGYQAAVLAELAGEVFSIEIVEPLAAEASHRLRDLGYGNVAVRAGDGYAGWPEHAPFDIVMLTAAPEQVPQPLLDQLRPGGRLVAPVGSQLLGQELRLIEKRADGSLRTTRVAPVRFVPFTRKPEGDSRGEVDETQPQVPYRAAKRPL
jgi:protein-L-isoaspartate(D-aspartate) O-methyltransferase